MTLFGPNPTGVGCWQVPNPQRPQSGTSVTEILRPVHQGPPLSCTWLSLPIPKLQTLPPHRSVKQPLTTVHRPLSLLCWQLRFVFNSNMYLSTKKASHLPPPLGCSDYALHGWSGDMLLDRLNFPYPIT